MALDLAVGNGTLFASINAAVATEEDRGGSGADGWWGDAGMDATGSGRWTPSSTAGIIHPDVALSRAAFTDTMMAGAPAATTAISTAAPDAAAMGASMMWMPQQQPRR